MKRFSIVCFMFMLQLMAETVEGQVVHPMVTLPCASSALKQMTFRGSRPYVLLRYQLEALKMAQSGVVLISAEVDMHPITKKAWSGYFHSGNIHLVRERLLCSAAILKNFKTENSTELGIKKRLRAVYALEARSLAEFDNAAKEESRRPAGSNSYPPLSKEQARIMSAQQQSAETSLGLITGQSLMSSADHSSFQAEHGKATVLSCEEFNILRKESSDASKLQSAYAEAIDLFSEFLSQHTCKAGT